MDNGMGDSLRPLVVIGVPRSGTTLLRVLLGTHSQIHGTLELPWITGAWGRGPSVRDLYESLTGKRENGIVGQGITQLEGIEDEDVLRACRSFVRGLLAAHVAETGKRYLLVKTPDDIGHLDFLVAMFPDAPFVHVRRDGRDVACSTFNARRRMMGGRLKDYGRITVFSALRRWCDWEDRVSEAISSGKISGVTTIAYEDLVTEPEHTMRAVCAAFRVPFEREMLSYDLEGQQLPSWDLGSSSVKGWSRIGADSVGRWKEELDGHQMKLVDELFGDHLRKNGYGSCRDELGEIPGAGLRRLEHWMGFMVRLPLLALHVCLDVMRSSKRSVVGRTSELWQEYRT